METATPQQLATPQHLSTIDWTRLALPGLIWGTSFYFIAEGLDAFPAIMITPMRIGFGFLTLACVPASRVAVRREAWRRIFLLAVLWMAVPLSMFPFAEERVTSSVTGMLNGATPLFVATVTALVFGSRPSRSQLVGLLTGFVGVIAIAIPTMSEGHSSVVGVLMILFALLCYGFALNIAAPLQQEYGALPVLWRTQAVALALTLPFGLTGLGEVNFSWRPLVMVAALGVFGTAIAYVLAATNAGRLGSTRASLSIYITPVVSLALGAVVRNEKVHVLSLLGCFVALVGAYLAGRRH